MIFFLSRKSCHPPEVRVETGQKQGTHEVSGVRLSELARGYNNKNEMIHVIVL
jgi:hypothetical protein